jgi:hypothetical protein
MALGSEVGVEGRCIIRRGPSRDDFYYEST